MITRLTTLLNATDSLCIRGEYKVWIYRNYIISLLPFHLCVDAVSNRTISQMESTATRYLKKWLDRTCPADVWFSSWAVVISFVGCFRYLTMQLT